MSDNPGNCKLCRETPAPSNYGSPRVCAFDERGRFTKENWNCETANLLRQFAKEPGNDEERRAESMYVRRDDQSFAALWVPPDRSVPPDSRDEDSDQFIAMTWYKGRGRIEQIISVRSSGAFPLTMADADRAVENLVARERRA